MMNQKLPRISQQQLQNAKCPNENFAPFVDLQASTHACIVELIIASLNVTTIMLTQDVKVGENSFNTTSKISVAFA
eukprot:m.77019 g.77019  ORF g.77019 m.77019 type:complete len:76 (-) comp24966_c0_seq3:31-258(-)